MLQLFICTISWDWHLSSDRPSNTTCVSLKLGKRRTNVKNESARALFVCNDPRRGLRPFAYIDQATRDQSEVPTSASPQETADLVQMKVLKSISGDRSMERCWADSDTSSIPGIAGCQPSLETCTDRVNFHLFGHSTMPWDMDDSVGDFAELTTVFLIEGCQVCADVFL